MKIENPKKFVPFAVGYVCVIVGAIVHIAGHAAGFWIFSAGAVAVTIARIWSMKKSDDVRTRRLQAQQLIGTGCLLGTAYLMYTQNNTWAITLLISAFIDIWVSYRMK